MGRKAVLALLCLLAAAKGEEAKAVNSSVVSDNVSAESAPRLYTEGVKVYASGAPYTLTFRAPDAARAASHVVPVKEESVFIQNQNGFLKDSYGNQYKVGSPQAVAYRTTFPQQYVRLQDLPVHLSQPLVPGFNFNGNGPQFSYTAPTFRFSTLSVTPTPITRTEFPSHGYASNVRGVSPVQGRYSVPHGSPQQQPSNSKAVYANRHYPGHYSPQQGPKFQRLEELKPHGFQISQGSGNLHNTKVIHSNKANLQQALQGGIHGAPAKQVTVTTYNNGKKATVTLDTQPLLPLLDLNLLQPLHFDNPIVPQVQHFLPKINYPIPQVEQKQHHKEFVVQKTKSYDSRIVPQSDVSDDNDNDDDNSSEEEEAPPPPKQSKKPAPTLKPQHNLKPSTNSYEINSPNYKETFNEQVVKYDKKTDSEPVHYTYNKQTESKPVTYSYTKSSKAPVIDKHLSYEVHGTGPKQQIIIHSTPESQHHHHEEHHHHEHQPQSNHRGEHHHPQGDHQGHHHHSPVSHQGDHHHHSLGSHQGDHHHHSQGTHQGQHHPQTHHHEERDHHPQTHHHGEHHHHPQSKHHEERHHHPQSHHQGEQHHHHPQVHHQGDHHHHPQSSRQEAPRHQHPQGESQPESEDSGESHSEESDEQSSRDYSGEEEQGDEEVPSHQLKAEHREEHRNAPQRSTPQPNVPPHNAPHHSSNYNGPHHNPLHHNAPQQIISNVQNQYGFLHSSPPPQFQPIVTTIQSITPEDDEETIRIVPTDHPNSQTNEEQPRHQNGPYNEHKQQHQNNAGGYHDGYNAQIQVHPKIPQSSPAPQIHYTTHKAPAYHVSSPQPQRQYQSTHPPRQRHHESPNPSPQSYYPPHVVEKSRKIIIQEETPDEMHMLREQMVAEMINRGNEDNEDDFEKAYKDAAFGFPAYERNAEQLEKDIYDPDSYGAPRYKEEDDFDHSQFQQYQEDGDEFPKNARLTYKDDKENIKEDYFLDYSVNKPTSYLDMHKSKVNYYKMFKKQKPKYYYGVTPEKKQQKSEKLTADLYGYNSYQKPKQINYFAQLKQEPHFEYNYAKEAPRDSYAYASSGPSKSRTLFVEPQFQYGFEPSSLPSLLDSELSAMASNNSPESEKPGTRKKIYQETFHIKKTSTASEPAS